MTMVLGALAASFGRRLDELCLRDEGGAYWLGVGPLDESTYGLYPSGSDLYAGTSGIALFLGYLGAITGALRKNPKPSGPTCRISRAKIGNSAVAPPNSTANRSSEIAPSTTGRERTNFTPSATRS